VNKSKLILITVAVIFVGVFFVGLYSMNNVQIESTYTLDEQSLIEKNGEQFLLLDGRELALSKDLHEKIDLQKYKDYKIKYVYNQLMNHDGDVVSLNWYGEKPWGK